MRRNGDSRGKKPQALVVVAKAPAPGLVKTRLCPYLAPDEAAALYECLLTDIVNKMKRRRASDFWLAFAPRGEGYFRRAFPRLNLLAQRGRDLGERLHHIFVDLSRAGYREIVVADSDSPAVPLCAVESAYRALADSECDVVLGPSTDGGYYLVGLRSPVEEIFRDIPWSSEQVLDKTLDNARALGLKAALLPPAYDIDNQDDLKRLWSDFITSRELRERAPRTYAWLKQLDGRWTPGDLNLDGQQGGSS